MLGWMKHKLESRLPGEILVTSFTDDTTLLAESEEELKSLLMKVKKESEKVGNMEKYKNFSVIRISVSTNSMESFQHSEN